MAVIKPIRIFWQNGIILPQTEFIISAIREFFAFLAPGQEVQIDYGSNYSFEGYKCWDPDTWPFDWIEAGKLFDAFVKKQTEDKEDFHFFVVTCDHLFYYEDEVCKIAGGWGQRDRGCIVDVGKESYLNILAFQKRLKTVIWHELGHLFLGSDHCGDINCLMYSVYNSKWVDFPKKPFCKKCLQKFLDCFKKMDSAI